MDTTQVRYPADGFELLPYAVPESVETATVDVLDEPDWTPAAIALASAVVVLCCIGQALFG